MANLAAHAPKAVHGGGWQASLGACFRARSAYRRRGFDCYQSGPLFPDRELIQRNPEGRLKVSYLLEPKGRNTAPAIALAVRHIQKAHGDDAVCLVLAADHLIS